MIYHSTILAFLSILLITVPTLSQDIDGLRNERELIDGRIELLNKRLSDPERGKTDLLDRYTIIQSKIEQQKALEGNITKEIEVLDQLLVQIQSDASAVSVDQKWRKKDLDKLIRKDFYRQLLSGSTAIASTSDELIADYTSRRYQTYLKDRTISDISRLTKLSDVIVDSIKMIEAIIADKEVLLLKEKDNSQQIEDDIVSSDQTLESIKTDASRLQKEVSERLEKQGSSNDKIRETIAAAPSTSSPVPSGKALDRNGRIVYRSLPWPVTGGVVTRGFGQANYGSVANLQYQNRGINMICPSGQAIRAVDGGRVTMSGEQPPYGHVIIVNHGEYDSAYFNIDKPAVYANDQVRSGDFIGSLAQNDAGSKFYFEIWYRQKQIDPLQWLIKQ